MNDLIVSQYMDDEGRTGQTSQSLAGRDVNSSIPGGAFNPSTPGGALSDLGDL